MIDRFHNGVLVLFCIFSFAAMEDSWGCENIADPYTDAQIIKLLGNNYQKARNLTEAKLKNSLRVKPNLVIEEFFKDRGLAYSKFEILQDFALMRWKVLRLKASPSYDLVIELGWVDTATEEKEVVVAAFVVAHRKKCYNPRNFNNPKKWNLINLAGEDQEKKAERDPGKGSREKGRNDNIQP